MKLRSAGHLHVEAVGKPLRELDICHANNSTAQNALYGPISSLGMVKVPPQSSHIDPSGGFSTASLGALMSPLEKSTFAKMFEAAELCRERAVVNGNAHL